MKIIKNRQINNLAWLSNYEIWILLEKLIQKTGLRIEFRHHLDTGKVLKCWYEGVYLNVSINIWIKINNNENHKK